MISWRGRARSWVRRISQVVSVFARFGFAWVLYELELLPKPRQSKLDAAVASLEMPERLRLALEELGPTAIKAGQSLASRGDLISPPYVAQLRELQDNVPAGDFAEIRQVIEDELGAPLDQLFAEFDTQPRATASIGQVHFAVLKDGSEVAVKVQRPGVSELIETDLHILLWAARRAERLIPWCAENHVQDLAHDFVSSLRAELNFLIEAQNTDRLKQNLAHEDKAYVPSMHWQLTTRRVLVIEWVHGAKPGDEVAMEACGVDPRAAAHDFAHLILRQIFRDGYFHGDPHAGNVMFLPGGRIAFLDCGNAVSIDRNVRDGLVAVLLAALSDDPQEICDQILALGVASDRTDSQLLTADIGRMLAGYAGFRNSSQVTLGVLLDELLALVLRHGVRMQGTFAAIARSLIVTEGICLQLDPRFDAQGVVREEGQAIVLERFSPKRLLDDLMRLLKSTSRYAGLLPRQTSQVLGKLQSGSLRIRISHENLERPLHRLDLMVNRITFALVVSAIIVSSTNLLNAQNESTPLGHYMTVLYVATGIVLGGWLLYSILRSGRL
jgi:ubiquinone biosynthesis protein